nr:dihydropteroate [uncultured bacterium]
MADYFLKGLACLKFRLPKVLGIVNITTDSFSDGGLYLDEGRALAKALELMADGADIIDLGAASSNPATSEVTPAEEIKRLKPVIDGLLAKKIPVSIDTFRPEVQQYALKSQVQYLNDIQGFPDPAFYPELAAAECKLIVMHSVQRLGPATVVDTEPEQVFAGIITFFNERLTTLQKAGISPDRIILDPGMGFFLGAKPESSLHVIKNITRLKEHFALPVLVSVSRKSFLGAITGRPANERGPATLAAELFLSLQGVDYLRTHDARSLKDALKVLEVLNS